MMMTVLEVWQCFTHNTFRFEKPFGEVKSLVQIGTFNGTLCEVHFVCSIITLNWVVPKYDHYQKCALFTVLRDRPRPEQTMLFDLKIDFIKNSISDGVMSGMGLDYGADNSLEHNHM